MNDHAADGDFDAILGKARTEIDLLDERIMALLADRHKMVDKVAAVKKEHGLPVYHPAREENLITARRNRALALGLDAEMVEELFRSIMRGSRITQGEAMKGRSVRPGAGVVIVGGRGQMGLCLGGWFNGAGYDVRSLDVGDWPRAAELCGGAKLALLCVPIEVTAETAFKVAPYLGKDCILADITSLKKLPLDAMLSAHGGPVLGLHPMFGPDTHAMDKQIVVVSEGRDHPSCRWVVEQLAAWGAVIVAADAEEHDRVMDVVQGLRHFATFSFGRFLKQTGVDLARTLEFSSPIYRLELGMVGRLFAQDPTLYAKIIFSTPQRRELLSNFVSSLVENLPMLENADEEEFLSQFKRVADWFGPFSGQAIRESGYLIDKMIERF